MARPGGEAARGAGASFDSLIAGLAATDGRSTGPSATGRTDATGTPADALQTLAEPLDSEAFAPSLGTRIALMARDGIEQARLNLNPAELGPIALRLSLDGTQLRVDMTAEHSSTRQVLEQSLPELASTLREAGFTLSGGGVFQQASQQPRDPSAPGPGSGLRPGQPDGGEASAEASTALSAPLRRTQGLVDVFA